MASTDVVVAATALLSRSKQQLYSFPWDLGLGTWDLGLETWDYFNLFSITSLTGLYDFL